MNADCTYFIGQGHAVCQDYAAAQEENGHCRAFLSDGCSSSPETDIGARLLVRAALRFPPTGENENDALRLAASWAAQLELPPEALDATLLTIDADTEQFCVRCAGDGVVALQRQDGALEIHVVQYPTGCPNYGSYRLSPARHARFLAQDGGKEVTTFLVTAAGVVSDGTVRVSTNAPETWTGRTEDYTAAAVFSDGAGSFTGPDAPDVPTVVANLLAFKTRRGAFVQRRALAFRRECARRGWTHADDLSVAAVQWGD